MHNQKQKEEENNSLLFFYIKHIIKWVIIMKILLMYNYNMYEPTIYRVDNQTYIKDKQKRYLLYEVQSEEELNELYILLNKYFPKNNLYKIVKTKSNALFVQYYNKKLVLIEIMKQGVDRENQLKEMLELPSVEYSKYNLDRSNWYYLWSKINDFTEYEYTYQKWKSKILDESIDYYMGMAETAISYLKIMQDENINTQNLYLSHKRIELKELYNPLNIVVDYKERDISEYLKYLFYNEQENNININEIINIVQNYNLQPERIYARLIYPTYFFDVCEKFDTEKNFENDLKKIIYNADKYEQYLKIIYNEFSKKFSIKKIDWL